MCECVEGVSVWRVRACVSVWRVSVWVSVENYFYPLSRELSYTVVTVESVNQITNVSPMQCWVRRWLPQL